MERNLDQAFIHKLADVATLDIGTGTRIWQFVVILPGAKIGTECNICSHVFIENDVIVGSRVTVKCGVQLWDGLRVGDDVFIGPNVTFTNDLFPHSKHYPEKYLHTVIEDGASIGAGAVILPGLTIGSGSLVAAGAVVTRSVDPRSLVRVIPPGMSDILKSEKCMDIGSCRIIELPKISDRRGNLTFIEGGHQVPFDIQRVYYLYDVPGGSERGGHAHKELKQLIIAMSGSFDVILDDGENKKRVHLNRSYHGLYVCPMIWRELDNFSSGSVCMVLASNYYDEADYYRDYTEFMRARGQG